MKARNVCTFAVGAGALALAAGATADVDVLRLLDSRHAETAEMASRLWEWAEVGYQEERSTELLQAALSAEGFRIEGGVAGFRRRSSQATAAKAPSSPSSPNSTRCRASRRRPCRRAAPSRTRLLATPAATTSSPQVPWALASP